MKCLFLLSGLQMQKIFFFIHQNQETYVALDP